MEIILVGTPVPVSPAPPEVDELAPFVANDRATFPGYTCAGVDDLFERSALIARGSCTPGSRNDK